MMTSLSGGSQLVELCKKIETGASQLPETQKFIDCILLFSG